MALYVAVLIGPGVGVARCPDVPPATFRFHPETLGPGILGVVLVGTDHQVTRVATRRVVTGVENVLITYLPSV
jgi:hypothetical protein